MNFKAAAPSCRELAGRLRSGGASLCHHSPETFGVVTGVSGLKIAVSIPGPAAGMLVSILGAKRPIPAEITAFDAGGATCMPLGELSGIAAGNVVVPSPGPLTVRCGDFLLGRVLDGLGNPIDGSPLPRHLGERAPVSGSPPPPLERLPINAFFETGVAAIDGFLAMGRGQRVGLFAGSGVGKSTLLSMIARNASSDINVINLVGERGREVGEFITGTLGPEGLGRSVVVAATGDQPPMIRLKSAFTAMAIAEHFRDRGRDVLFMMDSVTRLARAQREVALSSGEPPARQGYPPSVFKLLPAILERAGNGPRGTMTAIFTVLVAGGDMDEPIADEVRGILDGHIVMSREIAARGRRPAIDIASSVSRLMPSVVPDRHLAAASRLRSLYARYESARDLISIGAYKRGHDRSLDQAVDAHEPLEELLTQDARARTKIGDVVERMGALAPGPA